MLDETCAKTALRRDDNQKITLKISASNMKMLKSIVKIIESINQKYTAIEIKVASIRIYDIEYDEHGKLIELWSIY